MLFLNSSEIEVRETSSSQEYSFTLDTYACVWDGNRLAIRTAVNILPLLYVHNVSIMSIIVASYCL